MTNFSGNKPLVEKQSGKPRVLVAPLDWGLGHATRCIPVIYELLKQNAEVWLAGENAQESLLRNEFPSLPFLSLKGYRVKYSRSASGLWRAIFRQLPRIWQTIRQENKWLKQAVSEYEFDAVISDNRFGLSHPSIPCIFITHQLHIKSPLGKWTESRIQRTNYRFINKFSECWVPDIKGSNNLAGQLSHPTVLPRIPVLYTGILSRLHRNNGYPQKKHLFISLSGPEPQRTTWENKIIQEIAHYPGTATIVRGLPEAGKLIPSTNDIHFFNHLPANDYNQEMNKAEWVISRSGYSTVMDIAMLGKKAILVPTPGQPEQEYLGKYLSEKGFAPSLTQDGFSLAKALELAGGFNFQPWENTSVTGLPEAVSSLLNKIKEKDNFKPDQDAVALG
ncbi:MAG: glycosyltransferase [Chitinophagaceae bacterium]